MYNIYIESGKLLNFKEIIMACISNGFGGVCHFFDEKANEIDLNLGADAEGFCTCTCEDNECPTDSCTYYESDKEE